MVFPSKSERAGDLGRARLTRLEKQHWVLVPAPLFAVTSVTKPSRLKFESLAQWL